MLSQRPQMNLGFNSNVAIAIDPSWPCGTSSHATHYYTKPRSERGEKQKSLSQEENERRWKAIVAKNLRLHRPRSTEDRTALLVVETLARERAEDTCYNLVPKVLYHDPLVAICIRPAGLASQYRHLPSHSRSAENLYHAMNDALQAIQLALSPWSGATLPSCLLAVSSLSVVDSLKGGQGFGTPDHLDGLLAIIASPLAAQPYDELTLTVLDHHCLDLSVASCVRGEASPVEAVLDEICLPDLVNGDRDGVTRSIKNVADSLLSRIPRLLCHFRRCLLDLEPWIAGPVDVHCLAAELLTCAVEAVENTALHDVHVAKVIDKGDMLVSSMVMDYHDYWRFEALLRYWIARLTILRVCTRLQRQQAQAKIQKVAGGYPLPPCAEIDAEAARLTNQILMSHTYARLTRTPSRRRAWAHALVTVWGALADVSDFGKTRTSGKRAWILQEVNATLMPVKKFLPTDLDIAAEILVGGPLGGEYAQLYTRKTPSYHDS